MTWWRRIIIVFKVPQYCISYYYSSSFSCFVFLFDISIHKNSLDKLFVNAKVNYIFTVVYSKLLWFAVHFIMQCARGTRGMNGTQNMDKAYNQQNLGFTCWAWVKNTLKCSSKVLRRQWWWEWGRHLMYNTGTAVTLDLFFLRAIRLEPNATG